MRGGLFKESKSFTCTRDKMFGKKSLIHKNLYDKKSCLALDKGILVWFLNFMTFFLHSQKWCCILVFHLTKTKSDIKYCQQKTFPGKYQGREEKGLYVPETPMDQLVSSCSPGCKNRSTSPSQKWLSGFQWCSCLWKGHAAVCSQSQELGKSWGGRVLDMWLGMFCQ